MRIAFFSDIHGNRPALLRALADAERRGVTEFLIAGDLVGAGPHPAEVVAILRERGITAIRGNVDRKVLARVADPDGNADDGKQANYAWTAEQLAGPDLAWLRRLPPELRLVRNGVSVRIVHGSPISDTDYVYPSITARGLRSKLGDDRPGVLVCGHSHVPFTRRIAGTRVVNCGSVGRPADGDARGSYALVDFADPARIRGRIIRFTYDVDALIAAIRAREVPGTAPDEYREGVKREGV